MTRLCVKGVRPPRGSMVCDGIPVRSLTHAPDGRLYVEREGSSTVLVAAGDILARIQVVE